MTAPLASSSPLSPRAESRGSPSTTTATPSKDDDTTAAQQAAIAAQHAAFDYDVAERAEMLREHEALESLMQEQLKNDDEIMKKWIAMI